MKVITDDLDIAILQKIRQEQARKQQDQMVQLELDQGHTAMVLPHA